MIIGGDKGQLVRLENTAENTGIWMAETVVPEFGGRWLDNMVKLR
jgi:hypothetical protein